MPHLLRETLAIFTLLAEPANSMVTLLDRLGGHLRESLLADGVMLLWHQPDGGLRTYASQVSPAFITDWFESVRGQPHVDAALSSPPGYYCSTHVLRNTKVYAVTFSGEAGTVGRELCFIRVGRMFTEKCIYQLVCVAGQLVLHAPNAREAQVFSRLSVGEKETLAALVQNDWNSKKLERQFGISKSAVYQRIQRLLDGVSEGTGYTVPTREALSRLICKHPNIERSAREFSLPEPQVHVCRARSRAVRICKDCRLLGQANCNHL